MTDTEQTEFSHSILSAISETMGIHLSEITPKSRLSEDLQIVDIDAIEIALQIEHNHPRYDFKPPIEHIIENCNTVEELISEITKHTKIAEFA